MQRPRMSIRSSMLAVAAIAIVCSAATRFDIPSLAKYAFWREGYPSKTAIHYQISPSRTYSIDDFPPDYAWRPKLAYWVIPVLTLLLVWPSEKKRVVWSGIGAFGAIALSWLLLKRFMLCIMVNYTWPDYHFRYAYQCIVSWHAPPFLYGVSFKTFEWYILFPPYAYLTMYMSADQMANLSCLVVLLIAFVARVRYALPRRLVAIVSLPPNVYTLIEWTWQMTSARSWVFRNTPFPGHSSEFMPHASGMEIVGGLMLIAMLVYLILVLVGATVTTAGLSTRGSIAWFGVERFLAAIRAVVDGDSQGDPLPGHPDATSR